jgi:hypothetical protein
MRFPRLIYITCGKPDSRKWNMERHVDLCHGGIGEYTTFTEYLSGRHTGLYGPSSMPPSKSQSKSIDYVKIYHEEAIRELARQNIRALSVPHQEQHPPISQSRQTQRQQQPHINSRQSLGLLLMTTPQNVSTR